MPAHVIALQEAMQALGAGPNINSLIIKLAGNNYASIFVIGPVFMLAAFFMVLGMKTKEPGDKSQTTTLKSESDAQQLE